MVSRRPSILRRMLFAFLAFGIGMGLIFPVFASLFVTFKEGLLEWFVAACIAAGIVMGLFSYWLLNIMLLKRLQRIGEVASAISQNDISFQCTLESDDFIGQMATSFNQMVENLRQMVSKIAEVSHQLAQSFYQLESLSKQTQDGIQKQKKETDEAQTHLIETAQIIQKMTHDSQAANKAAQHASQSAQHGLTVVNHSVTSISALAQEVESSSYVIQQLREDSENIGSVLAVIKEIAEQTNLLALNAAIEAARAGEHGRGFAVVADEVRNLANRTQESAKQIEAMILGLQSNAQEAYQKMNQGREKAQLSVSEASEAGAALKEIVKDVEEINAINSQVAQAADQGERYTEQLLTQIEQISAIAESVAQDAEKSTLSTEEVENYAQQLEHLIRQFNLDRSP